MDIQREREAFEIELSRIKSDIAFWVNTWDEEMQGYNHPIMCWFWHMWQAAKAQQKTPQFNLDEFLTMEEKLKHKGGVITADLDRFIAYAEMALEKAKALKEPK